ncbi:PQQ-binding-like beta-propeller repeat protein [candidate division KSB1 bacterium]|nr:PQQ-binding-like beta-propeller repeat protein [candidate division KSB1 bacterium]
MIRSITLLMSLITGIGIILSMFAAASDFSTMQGQPDKILIDDNRINDDPGDVVQEGVQIAAHPEGPIVLAWTDYRQPGGDIYMQLFNRRGFPYNNRPNFKVNDDAGGHAQSMCDVAMDGLGNFLLVWADQRNGDWDIYGQWFYANGDRKGANFRIDDDKTHSDQIMPAVAMQSDGSAVVMWADKRWQTSYDIYMKPFSRFGKPLRGDGRAHADTAGMQINPKVDMNYETGDFIAGWLTLSDDKLHVYVQRYYPDGKARGDLVNVTQPHDVGFQINHFDLAMQGNHSYMVCWQATSGTSNSDIFARIFSGSNLPLTAPIMISEAVYPRRNVAPRCAPTLDEGWRAWSIVWQGNRDGSEDIYHRILREHEAALPQASERINDPPAAQMIPVVATRRISDKIFAWTDTRNGLKDIYAAWQGSQAAIVTSSGSGFNGMVPITWEPPFAFEGPSRYIISRRSSPSAPMQTVATVDPWTRLLPSLMHDWIDTDVENGVTYTYQLVNETNAWATQCTATPAAEGHHLQARWASITPIIDGFTPGSEWHDALITNIKTSEHQGVVQLLLKNDSTHLYLAVVDFNDDNIEAGNRLTITFDDNHDKQWPSAGPSGEGALSFNSASALYSGFWGTYPDALGGDAPIPATGVIYSIDDTYETISYEIAIDLAASPLQAQPGETIGFGIGVFDPGHYSSFHYGNSGEWPKGALWEAAETLGDLTLALPAAPLPPTNDWPMINQNPQRSSWQKDEHQLQPPFAFRMDFSGFQGNTEDLIFADGKLYAIIYRPQMSDGMNALYAFDYETQSLLGHFTIPGSRGSAGCTPAVSDSIIACGSQASDGLYAVHSGIGSLLWHKPIGDLFGHSPIIDSHFIYVLHDSLYCIYRHNGNIVWTQPVAPGAYAGTPAVDHINIYYVDGSYLHCYRKESGNLVWQVANDGYSSIAVDDQSIYTTHQNAVVARKKTDGAIQWSFPFNSDEFMLLESIFAYNQDVLCFSSLIDPQMQSEVYAINKDTGALLWHQVYDSTLVSRPIIANNCVYLSRCIWNRNYPDDERSQIIALDVNHGGFLWGDSMATSIGQPIVAQGTLFIPTLNHIYGYTNTVPVQVDDERPGVANDYDLLQNYPNPFNAATTITYELRESGPVTLAVYNMLGQQVRMLLKNQIRAAGRHETIWDGLDQTARSVPSGIYLYRLETRTGLIIKKLLLLR